MRRFALIAVAATPPALQSVEISLPDEESMFTGPDADLLNANCAACHSAEMVLYQPRMDAAHWAETVKKMRDTYKAAIADKDVPAIVQYLTKVSAQTKGGEAPTAASSDAGGASGSWANQTSRGCARPSDRLSAA